jgi:hypothetical protein
VLAGTHDRVAAPRNQTVNRAYLTVLDDLSFRLEELRRHTRFVAFCFGSHFFHEQLGFRFGVCKKGTP